MSTDYKNDNYYYECILITIKFGSLGHMNA